MLRKKCLRCGKRFRLFHNYKESGLLYQDEFLSHGYYTCHRCPGEYLPNGDPVPANHFDDFVMDTSRGYGVMRRRTEAEKDDEWTMPPAEEEAKVGDWERGVYTTATSHVPYVEWWDYKDEEKAWRTGEK